MKNGKLYEIYDGLPSYARGIVVVGVLALTYVIGKSIVDGLREAADSAKAAERQKQFQAELDSSNSTATYPDSQYTSWANGITSAFSGCDWTSGGGNIPLVNIWGYWSDSGAAIYNILDQMNNDADFLKLQRAFDIRTITKSWACGGDYNDVDLTAAVHAQLNQKEINGLNSFLESKSIKYRF